MTSKWTADPGVVRIGVVRYRSRGEGWGRELEVWGIGLDPRGTQGEEGG